MCNIVLGSYISLHPLCKDYFIIAVNKVKSSCDYCVAELRDEVGHSD